MRLDFRMVLRYQSGMQRSWPCLDPATLQRSGENKTGIARPSLCPTHTLSLPVEGSPGSVFTSMHIGSSSAAHSRRHLESRLQTAR